ncbi:ANL family adenylate-forming protein [Kutzneria sp. CA-103260]|uniref:ANL family adenylate-forming protein n=1 Tax=Kutzneria sp. CA-103260 TaxID=2802641 RepID=UPI001BAC0704|nr:fatty acid--CoA ligase family protein [Kutzneria sp. CA-103260]QUQ66622.1 long-chain-fatty-acid--CoA ligase [Kutzneria sp. CA-103260]
MNHSFLTRLAGFGAAEAMIVDGVPHDYASLCALVGDWTAELDRHGVRAGDVVCLEAAYSPAACAALLALIARGAIIVPLSSTPPAKRAEFLAVAEVESVITVKPNGNNTFTSTGGTASHELYGQLRATATPGLVLFSSGTSGRSKASLLDFDKVLGRYGEPSRPRRTLSFLSLDHIGGINTLLHTFSQGGAIITVPERTPDAVFTAIERDQVGVLPTTPTFLNMALVSRAYERHRTDSLELITYGTEPMPPKTLDRLRSALPGVRLKQTYGLSELGIMPTRSRADDSLWLKIGGAGFDYKIVDDVLWVRSDMAMLGYLNAPADFDADGYFNTQDVVRVDGDYVRILGRRSEIINVGGEKVYPSEVEGVLLEMPNVADVTVSGRQSHVTGMVVKATIQLIEDEDERAVRRRVREFCGHRLEPFKVPVVVEVNRERQYSERFKKIRSVR